MEDKLFPSILRELEEYKNSMALIDVLNKLEKLELLKSSDKWIDYKKLRNSLTHEYPNNSDEVLEAIGLSIKAYEDMKNIYFVMLKRVGLK
jgi:glycine cleavage system H lipoate-binding protein